MSDVASQNNVRSLQDLIQLSFLVIIFQSSDDSNLSKYRHKNTAFVLLNIKSQDANFRSNLSTILDQMVSCLWIIYNGGNERMGRHAEMPLQ